MTDLLDITELWLSSSELKKLSTVNWWSSFKTLIICQLQGNRRFQSYSQLSFPSLVDPPHYEKCGSATFIFFFLWLIQHPLQSTDIYFRAAKILPKAGAVAFRTIKIRSNLRSDIPIAFRATWSPSAIGIDKCSFQSYQNTLNSETWHSCWLWPSEPPKSYQWWELTLPLAIAFKAIKILSNLIDSHSSTFQS